MKLHYQGSVWSRMRTYPPPHTHTQGQDFVVSHEQCQNKPRWLPLERETSLSDEGVLSFVDTMPWPRGCPQPLTGPFLLPSLPPG